MTHTIEGDRQPSEDLTTRTRKGILMTDDAASKIIELAEKLASENLQDWDDDELRQKVVALTDGLEPNDVRNVIHRASLIAELRYQRLEEHFIYAE